MTVDIHGIADMNRSSFLLSTLLLTVAALPMIWAPALAQESQSTVPAAADPALAATDAEPATAESMPATTEAEPATAETAPAETDAEPATAETAPAETDSGPATAETAPAETDSEPAAAEAAPAETDSEPATAEAAPAAADAEPSASAAPVAAAAGVSAIAMSDVLDMLKRQQAQLDEQKRQLEEQQQLIAALQGQAETELAAEKETSRGAGSTDRGAASGHGVNADADRSDQRESCGGIV